MTSSLRRTDAFLPTSTAQCHAANLLELPGGDLGCAWFGGTQEGMSDICVWFARLGPAGWSEPVRVSEDPHRSEQNPVLFAPTPDELWLLYTAQHAGDQDTAEVRMRVSRDGGASWTAARTLVPPRPDAGVFVRQPIVAATPDRWLLPVFCCVRPDSGSWVGDHDYSAVLVSDDHGAGWSYHRVPDSTGCVHMNILRTDDEYVALFRRRQADAIHLSRSPDGVKWSSPEPTELPNNNSSIQAAVLRDGSIVVAYNASSAHDATDRRTSLYDEIAPDGGLGSAPATPPATGTAFWGAPRAPMTLAVSWDAGRTWPVRRDIETGDGYCLTNNSRDGLNRELSYPSIVQTTDGAVHLAYTHFRQAIKHVRIDESWLGHRVNDVVSRPASTTSSAE